MNVSRNTVIASCLLATAGSAWAGSITHSGAVDVTTTNWEQLLEVPAFDSLGGVRELTSISITLTGTVVGEASTENLDAAPATIELFLQAEVSLSLAGMDLAVTLPVADEVFEADAFDGVIDFDGPSGASFPDLEASDMTMTLLVAGVDDLSAWIDTGIVPLDSAAVGMSFGSGAGNFIVAFATSAGLTYEIIYEFDSACPGEGDCCDANGTPGCDDEACCNAVCAAQPFCCDVAWDDACAEAASDLCGDLCVPDCPGEGDCCEANGTPGCDNEACCNIVCAEQPFCCDVAWDATCAEAATDLCGDLCVPDCPGEGDCCEANGTPGCDNEACCNIVCAEQPFCCDVAWDATCAETAADLCGDLCVPDCPGEGDCCEANGTPGCDNEECCNIVCAMEPFCCDTAWDLFCAKAAAKLCGELCVPDCPGEGDCCEANGTPGCDNEACCLIVCEFDPFCCDVTWDGLCAEAAARLCGDLCPPDCPGEGDCCEANGTPGCDNEDCCLAVCAIDAFCCDVEWDQLCADQAAEICIDLCAPGDEGCTPGYWKQSHHFDSWPMPYTPDTLFSDVFEDAFPGMTLVEVLKQGGGGLKALGRHTVAALLNGASDGVNYELSDLEVIMMFNDVYPGGNNAYQDLKDVFETFNELGCPLN